ncbi:MAG: helix-hairpin-helix domain-containing protein [Prolixibacteraceae bacterium]|nr:helix-hairpin-helix domain-containing protein [Prolixibacteraceae bacterium]
MNFKQFFQDYFTFSRNERRGITVLLVLIFLLAIANKLIFYFETPGRLDPVLFDSARVELGLLNDSLAQQQSGGKLFSFNPNSIDSVSLSELDLPVTVTQNLLKFRNKGGRLYQKSDFRKIYGVTDDVYLKIEPYLQFDELKVDRSSQTTEFELFVFDPNKASDSDFHRLGLSEKQIKTIRNYQSKGGSFRSKDDFFKIWGLTDYQKSTLSEFVRIEQLESPQSPKSNRTEIVKLELNSADSTELETLPGIGDKLSKRIVKYREMLGGFYSLSQLKEVYGLNEQTIQMISEKLTIDATKIKKIDWNFADAKELSRHPYLRNNLSKQIVTYRSKNGSIKDLSVLRDSMILNIDEYNRLKPYF